MESTLVHSSPEFLRERFGSDEADAKMFFFRLHDINEDLEELLEGPDISHLLSKQEEPDLPEIDVEVDKLLRLDEDLICFNENILFSADEIEANDDNNNNNTANNNLKTTIDIPNVINNNEVKLVRNPTTKLYHCPHCSKSFQYGSRLRRHLTSHQRKQFHCEICDKLFSRADVLKNHVDRVHNEGKVSKTGRFQCHKCDVWLQSQHQLNRHLQAHVNQVGEFKCSICAKNFVQKHKFQRHVRLHVGEKKFKCDSCGMAFLQKEFLSRHLLTHSGENPFPCPDCSKAFNQLGNLKLHRQRVHGQSDKNHQCQVCDKLFFTATELKSHVAYHQKQRAFACSVCDMKFYEKCHLDRHIRRRHSKIKRFFCQSCGKAFFEKYELNFHLKKAANCVPSNLS